MFKLKILTVVLNLEKGGTQRAAQNFARGYSELGHDSRVLSLYGLGSRYEEIKKDIIVYNTLDVSVEIASWSPDIIHIHSHGPKNEDIEKLLDLNKTSLVIETNVFSKPSPWAERLNVSFQLSQWAQWVFDLRGGWKYKSVVVPNPVDVKVFKNVNRENNRNRFCEKYGLSKEKKILGRIGQAFDSKWSSHLIDIFNSLKSKDPEYQLVVVNPPKVIISEINKSNYRDSILVIDEIIGDVDLIQAYSSFDLTVLIAEQGESFGMVIAESILCGTPVMTISTPWADNSQCEVSGLDVKNFVGVNKYDLEDKIKRYFMLSVKDKNELLCKLKTKIYDNFNYLSVSELSLSKANDDEVTNKDDIVRIREVLNHDSLTNYLLSLNSLFYRKFTIYTTGYRGIYKLPLDFFRYLKSK